MSNTPLLSNVGLAYEPSHSKKLPIGASSPGDHMDKKEMAGGPAPGRAKVDWLAPESPKGRFQAQMIIIPIEMNRDKAVYADLPWHPFNLCPAKSVDLDRHLRARVRGQ